ncbi:response regulator transcription factor [Clostridium botulinum]|uniref:Stage 0 sporulation protein A homolog n=1 Tax=Clostridium botulinum C/D str. DC5 TaxID=1443128 RepID=A0A0A0IK72_CLOBO|nr:response regulator transcription factor [Clostridium botulinum]KEI07190.1 XRE family transcriptional regulator [Clostridium botulinum C/D str. BKT75002]KEI08748.1 XRE family transcriptional regulator [Clostridium botulinum C/D str. BKT2873]KGM93073.1 XRE family transcriptional regulator [Clostridium botulinum D str. CCUG 7971]KGN00667.1 XRE family transcriptional regulator [Clostridium botulinum C/D str. DC5]KOC45745.1 XRE family transcriptional regulator [Clostridium botulinum]
MNKINILVIEDDNDINKMLAKLIEKKGYNVKQAYSGTEGMLYIESLDFQLILLDLMLPGMTGEELIKKIRKTKKLPIIVISAKLDKEIKLKLFKLGADDYVTKPFDIDELSARIDANLRRYIDFNNSSNGEKDIVHKDIILNKEAKEVFVSGQELSLTSREFNILELLLTHPKKVFSKANLFESVWGDEYLGDDNTVNVHISNLRNKLNKASPNEEYIETVWGMGYKLK